MSTKTWREMHPNNDPNKSLEIIVSMVNYKDMVIVATQWNIFSIKDGKLSPIEFEVQED